MDDCLPYAPPRGAPTDCDGSRRSMARTATAKWYTPLQDTIRACLRRYPDGARLKEIVGFTRSEKSNVHKALLTMLAQGRVERTPEKKWRIA